MPIMVSVRIFSPSRNDMLDYNGFLSLKTPIYRDLRSLSDVHETPKGEQAYRSQLNESLQDRQQAADSVLLVALLSGCS